MFCFLIQTGTTELEPPELRGYLKYFYAFKRVFYLQISLYSTKYKQIICYKISSTQNTKEFIIYLYVFIFGHPNKRPESLQLLQF